MLTDADIKLIGQTLGTRIPGASDYSSWPGMGYEKDVDGRYTVPCFPAIGYPFARAIESAATAPLLARIAELDRSLDVMAQNTESQAHASLQREIELTEKVEKLTRELAEARKDAERYRWLCGFSSVSMPELTWGRRAGIPKNKLDAAIDAAIKEQT